MRTRNCKRIIDNWLLSGLAIGMILLFGTLLTDTLGLGPPQCPDCTRWNGTFCQPYCDEIECRICGPGWFCCPNGRCAPLGQICCGTTFCPPDDGCCENIACRIPGDNCCNNGTGHSCPPGYTCHGAQTCCGPGWSYCPGAVSPGPVFDCCPPDYTCVGNGRCCPNGTTLCEGPGGMWSCCDPSYCNESCIDGWCQTCGGDPTKSCCGGECYDTSTQKCCQYDILPAYYICDINETCCNGFCCDPEECESCFLDIYCAVCDGDPELTCINGHCCCAPNGCGPCGGSDIIPDNPTGCDDTSFLEPCNAHDVCYGTCGSNKEACDNAFLGEIEPPSGMYGICVGSSCVSSCYQKANEYYGAVQSLGQEPFDAAQACSCG